MYYKGEDGNWYDSETNKKYSKKELRKNVCFRHRHERFLYWLPTVLTLLSVVFMLLTFQAPI